MACRIASVMLAGCCALATPIPAAAQQSDASQGRPSPLAAWLMTGLDVSVQERWRGVVRIGHLGDIDSLIVLADSTFVARPAMHAHLGYVYISPVAPESARTSLLRGGASWLPVRRRRLTLDNRFLVERRATTTGNASMRYRNRLRVSAPRPGGLPFGAFGSTEVIAAAGHGVVEHRMQLGLTGTIGRLSVESYWIQRRLLGRAVVNGVGLTTSWRIRL